MQSRHGNLVLGWFWNLVDPMLLMAVYWFVFGLLLESGRPTGFLAQLAVGIFLYQFCQNVATQGSSAMEANREMIRQMHFPRAVLPLSEILRNVVYLAWQIPVMALLVIDHAGFRAAGWIAFVLLVVPVFAVFSFGLALTLARATFAVRDVSRLIPYIFRLGFYFSGALFPLEPYVAQPTVLNLLVLNPIYAFIALARSLVVAPAANANLLWGATIGWSILSLTLGMRWFLRVEARFGHA